MHAIYSENIMRPIDSLVIHCADSREDSDLFQGKLTPVQVIDSWHAARGFSRDPVARAKFNPGLTSIGYHFVIYRNGGIATGRAMDEIGAHAKGYNKTSLGICLVGREKFTLKQWQALKDNILSLKKLHPNARIVGHGKLPGQNKTCPNFDVAAWWQNEMAPPAGHIYPEAR